MRLDTWARLKGAEVGFFSDFREPGCARFTKITVAERRRRVLIADESRLQDGGLVFSNIVSYTPLEE